MKPARAHHDDGPTIIEVMEDPRILGAYFSDPSWDRWKVCLAAAFGLAPPKVTIPTDDGKLSPLEFFRKHTGRTKWPTQQAMELWCPVGRRGGKALAVDTPIPTPNGWTTMGELRAGDLIYGRDGQATRVLHALPVEVGRPCYEVEFSNGEVVVADEQHEWMVEDRRARKELSRRRPAYRENVTIEHLEPIKLAANANDLTGQKFGLRTALYPVGINQGSSKHVLWATQCDCGRTQIVTSADLKKGPTPRSGGPPSGRRGPSRRGGCGCMRRVSDIGERIVTTAELRDQLNVGPRAENNFAVRLAAPIQAPEAELPIDPYVLGTWLGDGHSAGGSITSADPEIIEEIGRRGFTTTRWASKYGYGILGLHAPLRRARLLKNKHVPAAYLRSSPAQRLDLLRGLMDTDGYCSPEGKCYFYSTNRVLAEGALELIHSLGWRGRIRVGVAKLDGRVIGPKYTVHFAPTQPVFLLPRKAARQTVGTGRTKGRYGAREFVSVVAVRQCPSVPVRCIQVENTEGVFLAGRSMLPTHNSRVTSAIAIDLACFRDYSAFLSPGEYGTLPVIAADRKQTRVVLSYIKAMLLDHPILRNEVEGDTAESITLKNHVRIEVHTASFRSTRGYTCVGAVLDEIAFWQIEGSASPDTEILNALRASRATIPNAMIAAISSPHARAGELWEIYKRHFGDQGDRDILVWNAASLDMNPTLNREEIAREYERDSARADAEYGGQFRTDVEKYVKRESVEACVAPGVDHLPPSENLSYRAFVDPSGGNRDTMTLAIGHSDPKGKIVLDLLVGQKAPFNPETVTASFAAHCKTYRIGKVYGDRFGGEFPRKEFRKCGIDYELHPKPKTDLYRDLLPHIFSKNVELLDSPVLVTELSSLQRKNTTARDIIDHPKGQHDDYANAVAGLVDLLARTGGRSAVWGSGKLH